MIQAATFMTELDLDVRLRDAFSDRDIPVSRKRLAALSLEQPVQQAWILAQEVWDAVHLHDLGAYEGAEWVAHIRATSRHPYQLAVLETAMMSPAGERVPNLRWLTHELKLRRRLYRHAREAGLNLPPLEPHWIGMGPSPLTATFVPSGWTAKDWAHGGDATMADYIANGEVDCAEDLNDPFEQDSAATSAFRPGWTGPDPFDPEGDRF